ncbi:MAG: DUF4250 domain-containing protein [Oscillospiraceae bacterium]|nr:DUF4250 domain-containing protein [Oscillospiraceae bacterium]
MLPQDPYILLSYLNTKLRDEYASLTLLCEDMDLEQAELEARMEKAGFRYQPEQNRFA